MRRDSSGDALLMEYQTLAESFDRHATVGYSILPAAVAAIAGAVFFGAGSSEYSGITAAAVLFVMLAWMGSAHSILNTIGLRLIAIELRLRERDPSQMADAPRFFCEYVGQSSPGLPVYFGLVAMVGVAALAVAMCQWNATLVKWDWPGWARMLGVAVPILMNAAVLATMFLVERKVVRLRRALVDEAAETELNSMEGLLGAEASS